MSVTVGISFYNAEKTLANAIRSVFAQTYSDWELVLVDDGSTDRSLEIARAVRDPRVRVISDGKNRRLGYRLNQISDLARGHFVARLDSHGLMHPERLAKQVRLLQEQPDVDVVGSHTYAMYHSDNAAGVEVVGLRGRRLAPLRTDARYIMRRTPVTHSTITGRTGWFRRIRYDATMHRGEDRDMWVRALLTGGTRLERIDQPLLFVYHEGITLSKVLQGYRQDRQLYLRYGPKAVGWPRTLSLLGKDFIRGFIWRLMAATNTQKALIELRRIPLDDDALRAANKVLASILRTDVPGLPPHEMSLEPQRPERLEAA